MPGRLRRQVPQWICSPSLLVERLGVQPWSRRAAELRAGPICAATLDSLKWHGRGDSGHARARASTTVDEQLLLSARRLRAGLTDLALLDEALALLLTHGRAVEIDAKCSVYDEHPLTEPDEWGDLASLRSAATAS